MSNKRKNSRRIGKKTENNVAKWFCKWTGKEFKSTPRSGGLHWARDNRVSGDIVPPIDYNFPFCVEVKRYKITDFKFHNLIVFERDTRIKLLEDWRQCCDQAEEVDKEPILFIDVRGVGKNVFIVVMDANVYDHIIKDSINGLEVRYPRFELVMFSSTVLEIIKCKDVYKAVMDTWE